MIFTQAEAAAIARSGAGQKAISDWVETWVLWPQDELIGYVMDSNPHGLENIDSPYFDVVDTFSSPDLEICEYHQVRTDWGGRLGLTCEVWGMIIWGRENAGEVIGNDQNIIDIWLDVEQLKAAEILAEIGGCK